MFGLFQLRRVYCPRSRGTKTRENSCPVLGENKIVGTATIERVNRFTENTAKRGARECGGSEGGAGSGRGAEGGDERPSKSSSIRGPG